MAFNSDFSIYEPEAWVETFLMNQYPLRPGIRTASSAMADQQLPFQQGSRNKKVNITRAKKVARDDARSYGGSGYTIDDPDADEKELTLDQIKYEGFKINKYDQRFALPSLVAQHFTPRYELLLNTMNAYVKTQLNKFELAAWELNTNPTIMDDEDVRYAKRFLHERTNTRQRLAAMIDPQGEFDLTGLSLFHQANTGANGAQVQTSGQFMGRHFGFDFMTDSLGSALESAAGSATVAGAASVGDTDVDIDDGAGGAATAIDPGSIVFFGSASGPDELYVIAETPTGGDATASLYLTEPLRQAVSDDDTITIVDIDNYANGRYQYFYDTEAVALVTAVAPKVDQQSQSIRRADGFDPVNNVNFMVTVEETKEGAEVVIEMLYGAQNFYPDRGIRWVSGDASKA